MKPSLRMGIVAVALISGAGMAAAAGTGTNPQSAIPKASASQAKDSLTLSSTQEKTIWQDASKQKFGMKAPAGFTAKVGGKVPSSVELHPLPTSVTNSIAALRPYEYAMLDQKVLIVNPTDKKVVDVITQSGASG